MRFLPHSRNHKHHFFIFFFLQFFRRYFFLFNDKAVRKRRSKWRKWAAIWCVQMDKTVTSAFFSCREIMHKARLRKAREKETNDRVKNDANNMANWKYEMVINWNFYTLARYRIYFVILNRVKSSQGFVRHKQMRIWQLKILVDR